jgi:hypothetical protein
MYPNVRILSITYHLLLEVAVFSVWKCPMSSREISEIVGLIKHPDVNLDLEGRAIFGSQIDEAILL